MLPTPNNADFYRRGQPFQYLRGRIDNRNADYYRMAQPFQGISNLFVVKDMMKSGMVIPFQR